MPGRDDVLPATIQSGVEPHGKSLASGRAQLDDAKATRRPKAGKRGV